MNDDDPNLALLSSQTCSEGDTSIDEDGEDKKKEMNIQMKE